MWRDNCQGQRVVNGHLIRYSGIDSWDKRGRGTIGRIDLPSWADLQVTWTKMRLDMAGGTPLDWNRRIESDCQSGCVEWIKGSG